MKKEKELVYWAGVFDFAGSIRWRKTKQGVTPTITLGSKNVALLHLLQSFLGGGVRDEKKGFRWESSGTTARGIIRLLAPHMRNKLDAGLLTWQPNKRGPKRNFPRARVVSLLDKDEG